MHEMGIMQGVLDACFDAAEDAGEKKITGIKLTIGEMTEIEPYALEFAFEALSKGTMAEGGTLEITMVTPLSRCRDCGHECEHDRFQMLCPKCDSFNLEQLKGRELLVDSITTKKE